MKKFLKALFVMLIICASSVFITFDSDAANASSQAGVVSTKSTSLNLREKASVSSAVVKQVKKGSYLTLLKKDGSWWKVEYGKNKTAYAHADYINTVSSKVMYVDTAGGVLNVRSGASTDSTVKTTLARDTVVLRLSVSGSFSKILYNGSKTGFVSSQYLTEKKPQYKKLSLNVPSFKQNDSRWSSVKIGIQGDTLGRSGCTTTALAMTESFHLGKTLNPADMVKRLTYSDSGQLYWPSEYNTEIVNSSDYLSRIYTLLSKGKPVVLGMKKSTGSQHWVVVTGHKKETSSLNAQNFTINDPGSESRTLLSEFVSVYPVVYKIAYRK